MKTERRYDIDWLRVIAIGLLLIYHIAIIFQPWGMLIGFIRSEQLMPDLWTPMTMLNVWRIPLLFYVSGMGLYFAIRKRNWLQMLGERARRILVPFIFGIVAITPLHMFLFQKYYNLQLSYYPHAGHLWFLGNIFVYVLVLVPVFFLLKRKQEGSFMRGFTTLVSHPLGLLSICVFFVVEVLLLQPRPFEMYAQTWHGFAIGLLAFFFGFLFVLAGKPFWENVKKWWWLYVGLASILYGIRLAIFDTQAPGYLLSMESNCWIFGVFGLAYKYLNKPSTALSYLSQAAYPVYIIHMFALYLGALIILPLGLPGMLEFVGIILFTGVTSYVIYEFVIRRIALIRPLFGLRWKAQKVQSEPLQTSVAAQRSH